MKFLQLSLLIFYCFLTNNGLAQKFNLSQCVDYALKNNLTIKQAELTIALSDIDVTQSKLALLPNLSGQAQQQYSFGRNVDPQTYQFVDQQITSSSFSLNSQMTLFGGFQRLNQIKQNKYTLLANQSQLEKVRNDLSINVVTAFINVLYQRELLNYATLQLETSKLQLERAKRINDVGNSTVGDLLDVKAQFARDELSFTNAKNSSDIALLTLRQFMEVPMTQNFDIDTAAQIAFGTYTAQYNAIDVYNTAKGTLPEFKTASNRLLAAEKGLDVARGAFVPRLTLGGSISSGYSSGRQTLTGIRPTGLDTIGFTNTSNEAVVRPGFEANYKTTSFSSQISNNLSQTVFFSLNIPIFNNWQVQAGARRAKINVLSEQLNVRITENNLSKTIAQAVADYNAAQKKYTSAKNSLDALEISGKNTNRKYEVGLVSYLDYSLVINNLAKSRSDFIQAKYDLIFRAKVIDYYMGKPLTF